MSDMSRGLNFPHDDNAERAVLGSVLLDARECWPAASELLRSSDFFATRHSEIWRAMSALMQSGSAIDLVLLQGQLVTAGKLELAGGDEYLLSLTETIPTTHNTTLLAKRVHDLALIREVMRGALRLAAEGGEPIDDVADYLDRASTALSSITDRRATQLDVTSISDALHKSYSDLTRRQLEGQSLLGHSTGLRALDHACSGFVPGDLIVIAGRPGMGKTSLANEIKLGIVRSTGQAVLSLELEMSGEQLTHRVLASEGGVNLRHIRSAQLSSDELRQLAITADELSRLPLFFIERRLTRVSELRVAARRLQAERGQLGAIVFDYLQIGRPERSHAQREREVASISADLKSLAGEFRCPVFALSQLNRSVESRSGHERRPRLSDLRESGAIEQDADTVIFVHREEVYDPKTPLQGIAELIIAKQRSGPLGTIQLSWQGAFTRFGNLGPQHDHEQQESFGYDEPQQPPHRSNGRAHP